jgi:hypothetical protein
MHSKEPFVSDPLKVLTIMLVLLIFLLFGCKGKEVTQPVSQPPVTVVEEEVVTEESPDVVEDRAEEAAPDVTDTVTGNTAPRINVLNVYPPNPVPGDTIKIDVKSFDKEGDPVSYTYQWWKNDDELRETSQTLSVTEDFKRGDKITVKIVPDDGDRKGTPVEMFVFIANSPPVVKPSAETFKFDGTVYSYQARAVDPDGDPLEYSLKSAPAGMTIDKENGLIQWNVPADYKGKANIIIAINDGQGGEIMQSFTLEIRPQFM